MTDLERKQERTPVPSEWTYAPAPESRDVVQLRERYGHFVGGEWLEPKETYPTISPATEEVLAEVGQATPEEVDLAVKAARAAYENGWSSLPGSERAKYLFRIARILQERSRELAVAESLDGGKPIRESRDVDLPLAAAHFFYYAGWADKLEYAFPNRTPRPLGVAGQVIPWNFPLLMLSWKVAPALAAGNTVVLKPSSMTPLTALALAELAADIFPKGVLNVITGPGATVGRRLVTHPDVDMVSLTGDTGTGKEIAAAAAQTVKRLHLELGGKAPVIVFDDADLALAAENIAIAGYFNAGQDCTAATRVLANKRVQEDLAAALVEQAGDVKLSRDEEPDSEDFYIPPLNNANQLGHVSGLLERAPDHAQVMVGGEQVGNGGYFYAPTVVGGLQSADEMATTEIFGPVITVQSFSDEDEAIKWANGTDYGLASSVWTSNHKRALRVSRALDFGCVWINCHIPLVAEMPHGGFKHSGHGKDLSMYGLEDYTRIKHVMSYIGQ